MFTITASAGAGGIITPSGAISRNRGEELTFRFGVSNPIYRHWVIRIDGAIIAADIPDYTFTDIDSNHTIEILPQVPTNPGRGFDVGGFRCGGNRDAEI